MGPCIALGGGDSPPFPPSPGCFGGRDGVGGGYLLISASARVGRDGGVSTERGNKLLSRDLGASRLGTPPGAPCAFLRWFDFFFSTSVSLGGWGGQEGASPTQAQLEDLMPARGEAQLSPGREITVSPRCPR